jgi:hypothetical protein
MDAAGEGGLRMIDDDVGMSGEELPTMPGQTAASLRWGVDASLALSEVGRPL